MRVEELKKLIDRELDRFLPSPEEEPKIIHRAIRYSVFSGGKRLRPILAIESCRVCGGQLKDVMPAACAIELVHTYSLIHDDLPAMDNDDYRRGRPSCHKEFGEANAILAGDALLTFAFYIIAGNLKAEAAVNVAKVLSEAIGTYGMVGGQVIDLARKDKKKDYKTLDRINLLKTARLFEASAAIGATASGADAKAVKPLARFGELFGMAFQIRDDVLDEGDYLNTVGFSEAKARIEDLIEDAKKALRPFGKKAEALKYLADSIVEKI